MVKRSFLLIVAVTFFISGCASIMSGTTQRVSIDSDPQGATVMIGKKKTKDKKTIMVEAYNAGVTPLIVELKRRGSTMVQISKDGYKTQDVQLKRTMNPWVWGDIALTSLLSTSIDTSTGACNEYKPGQYMISLETEK